MATTRTPIGSTIAQLEGELPQLEARQMSLEKDLRTAVERLTAVRAALHSLTALSKAPPAPTAFASTATTAARGPASRSVVPAPRATKSPAAVVVDEQKRHARKKTATPAKKTAAGKKPAPTAQKPARKRPRQQEGAKATPATTTVPAGGLAEAVYAVLAGADAPMRAGDVNTVLGRTASAGRVNSVRSTLERLTGDRRVKRVGRGLYRAAGK